MVDQIQRELYASDTQSSMISVLSADRCSAYQRPYFVTYSFISVGSQGRELLYYSENDCDGKQ